MRVRSTTEAAGPIGDRQYARRAATASMVGSIFEWYDFYLYGTATALVFNKIFFTGLDSTAGVLAAFATYAVGFLARPLGAVVAGRLADQLGRRPVLVWSLIAMGVATTLVGALPTYHRIGLVAPITLVLLRLAQGFAAGAEQGGAAVFMIEHSQDRRRGWWGSLATSGAGIGLLFASGAFVLVERLPAADLLTWGWRIPFLISPVLVVVGLVIRASVPEPSVFARARPATTGRPNAVHAVLRDHRRRLGLGVGLRLSQTAASYFYTVFSVYYVGVTVGRATSLGVIAVAVSSALSMVSAPLWGRVSDRFGRRGWYLFGAIGSALYIGPFFLLVDTRSPILIVLGVIVGLNVFHDCMSAPQPAWLSELFPTSVRGSGVALSYQVGAVLGGGILPLVATFLLFTDSGQPWLIVGYFGLLSVITIVAACRAPETGAASLKPLVPIT
jgi:MFS family permease